MKKITETRTIIGGKTYFCPWNDYKSTSFWATYGHAIACANRHGYFAIPKALFRLAGLL